MKKTSVKMLETKRGCSDGIKVETFEKGKTYFISKDLADVFIKELKVAKLILYANKKADIATPKIS